MGFPRWTLPTVCALLGALALAGIPPLAAAMSKDAVLEAALRAGDPVLILAFASALVVGAAYLVRWYLLITTQRSHETHPHADARMRAPLPVLLTAVIAGAAALPFLHAIGVTTEFHVGASALLSLLFAITGGLLAYAATRTTLLDWLARSPLAMTARARFLMDDAYTATASGVVGLGRAWAHVDDRGVNRGVRGVANITAATGSRLRHIITGRVRTYIIAILLGALAIILLVRWSP
jgi:NADH-quinone oxidoreductase subunit L